MSKIIKLTQGCETVVDDENYDFLTKYDSYAQHIGNGIFYAMIRLSVGDKAIPMHRIINNTPDGMKTDHINHNTLDNRKENLRICNVSQNAQNKKWCKHSSKYKGVCYDKYHKKWRASIWTNNRALLLGYFLNENDAGLAYNRAAVEYFGNFAHINIIEY